MLYIPFPEWLNPEIIPGLPLRWYALMYLVAFGITYLLFRRQAREQSLEATGDDIANLFFFGILGLLLGARIFSTLVYDTTGIYWQKPWLIFWPFDGQRNFTGLQGMSFHGGAIGLVLGGWLFTRLYRKNFWHWADLVAAGVPLGYTFGRLGNFINGELYGRVTTAPWGMLFPRAERFPVSDPWVQETAAQAGVSLEEAGQFINLPRHPSQLYEAFFEGIFLWLILWFFVRKKKPFHGFVTASYLTGYGLVRFVIEYFREPDRGIGFPLQFGTEVAYRYRLDSFLNFSMGQILCLLMILGGIGLMVFLSSREKRREETLRRQEELQQRKERAKRQSRRRK